MFAQLSSKWFTCNPLKPKQAEKPAEPAPAPPAPAPAPPAQTQPQNLFAAKPISAPAPSPFTSGVKSSAASEPSPFTAGAKTGATSKTADVGADNKKDYNKVLTDFYQRHNAQKLPEVAKTLEKYKVRLDGLVL